MALVTKKQIGNKISILDGVSPLHIKFVKHYIDCYDAFKALTRCGLSVERSEYLSKRILKSSKVKRLLKYFLAKEIDKIELNRESIVKRYSVIANAKISDYLRWDRFGKVTIATKDQLTPEQLYAIDSIEKTTSGFKLKLVDRMKALEMLTKIEGLASETTINIKNTQTGYVRPPLEALTKDELDTYKRLVQKMLNFSKNAKDVIEIN